MKIIILTLCLLMVGTASASDLTAEGIRSQLEDCHVMAREVKGENPVKFKECVEDIERVIRPKKHCCEYTLVNTEGEWHEKRCVNDIPCPDGRVR